MKKTLHEPDQEIDINEGIQFGIAIERVLKSSLNQVKATDDIGTKIDVLMKSLHFSLGSIALNLTKNKRHR